MHINKATNLKEYDTFADLMKGPIKGVYSYGNDYYVILKPEHEYDERAWKVNQKTQKVEEIHIFEYLRIASKAEPVDLDTLKRWVF